MHQAHQSIQHPIFAGGRAWLRLSPLVALLALTVFPFEWLGAQWPPLGRAIDHTFPTEVYHSIGHTTLFTLLGIVALRLIPALRRRPGLYAGLLMIAAFGQEALQLVFKHRPPAFDDARDLTMDLIGLGIGLVLVWLWTRAAAGDQA